MNGPFTISEATLWRERGYRDAIKGRDKKTGLASARAAGQAGQYLIGHQRGTEAKGEHAT